MEEVTGTLTLGPKISLVRGDPEGGGVVKEVTTLNGQKVSQQ